VHRHGRPRDAHDGDLEGCWYFIEWEVVQQNPGGSYQQRGEELFVGCLLEDGVDACGTSSTNYKLTQEVGPSGRIHGRCQHPLVGGTGDFADVSGRIDMKEDIAAGPVHYRGHLKL
jgi:hypothetical protein